MGDGPDERGISRRELLERAAAAGAAGALGGAPAAFAGQQHRRRRRRGPQVAVLGGGMAGLAAAHELAERGFAVTVYERNALGGKARSIPVPGTAAGGRRDLPGEHGFRFFPGFYHHVPDTMRRIPFPGNANGVWDNLVAASDDRWLRAGDRPDGGPFGIAYAPQSAVTVDGLRRILLDLLGNKGVPPDELAYFVERLLVFVTSSDERRFGEWEYVSWWDFIRAQDKSDAYKKELAAGLTRDLVAAKETLASTRTIGHMGEAFVWNILGQGNDGAPDRVLSLPTNEAWIDPWILLLRTLGVRLEVGRTVEGLEVRGGRIAAALMREGRHRRHRIEADWFVLAMPVERARRVLGPGVRALDSAFDALDGLSTDWMAGIQFYLPQPVHITAGHMTFMDAPWALTGLTQAQFWNRRDFARDYGDGTAVDCLSIDISDWDTPGALYGLPAKQCTREQIAKEVWTQVKAHHTAGDQLPADVPEHWFLDPGIAWVKSRQANRNATPLLVNTVGSWFKRPQAQTSVPNLFLAGDYVQTNIDLATMEGGNESGRAAVAALLHAAGSSAAPPAMYKLYEAPEFAQIKAVDAARYAQGQPNLLDVG
ncbi:MAG TPA: FAD-dependent oxidoreductase [Solirubrobacteraceae bacterium]|nr:FAD-dependent oxidoreductase [Solirubrobacteraceae bacterium]